MVCRRCLIRLESSASNIALTGMKFLVNLIQILWNVISIMNVNASLSGMNAAQTRLDVSAYNIANLSTQNFTRQAVTQSDSANGGASVSLTSSPTGTGNNLEADMVEQLQSKNTYLANLSVFKAKNDMMGALININT